MAKTATRPTNDDLNSLVSELGFEAGEVTEKYRRVWRHPQAGTVLLLPSNRVNDEALEVDLISLRTHLDGDGHMQASQFDLFVQRKSREASL